MKKLFCYSVIFFFTFNALKAARIYQMIYHPTIKQPDTQVKKETKSETLPKQTKKNSLKETLNYLRNKKNKTDKEKNSLSFLEGMNL
jgi:Na+-translocating ferredoxin:NAD+ oxidoreductase RnfG subunit